MKTFKQFQEETLLEYETDKNGRYVHKGTYGGSYDDPEGMEDQERKRLKKIADATGEKRGRGRPAGSKSGARKGIGSSKLHREEVELEEGNSIADSTANLEGLRNAALYHLKSAVKHHMDSPDHNHHMSKYHSIMDDIHQCDIPAHHILSKHHAKITPWDTN